MNIHGIYNYDYDYNDDFINWKKFDYPKSVKDELKWCHKKVSCMDMLLTCLYNQYFLVEKYKDNVQEIEGKYCNQYHYLLLYINLFNIF